jgi:hypothetical protein
MRIVSSLIDLTVGRGPRTRSGPLLSAVFVAAAMLAAVVPVAHAADTAADADRETALREKANTFMASSNWKDALPIWAELYGIAGKPLDLWNAAVCQYHLAVAGQATPEQALALLHQYRESPNVSAEKKAKAQRYIDEMTALKQRRAASSPAPQPAPVVVAPPPPAAPPPAPPVANVAAASPPAPQQPQEQEPRFRAATWTAAGVGAAALITGIYFSVRTHSLDNKVTNESPFNASDDSAGRQAATLQYVMYGVSAAALATAGILYYVGSPRGESTSVAVAPVAAPGRAGAALTVRF